MSEDDAADEDWFESALEADEEGPERGDRTDSRDADATATPPTDHGESDAEANPSASPTGDAAGGAFDGDDASGEAFSGEDTSGGSFGGDDAGFGAEAGSGEGMFDEDFASAFEGEGGEEGFDEEDFETDIPRLDLGIAGLDDMIQGGIPQRHLMTAIGSAGTGKTTFGLQFLHHGLQEGEHGVFITLEQSHSAIVDTANEWGWDFEAYEDAGELAIVDLDPVEMANSLDNIRGELPELIEDFGADRLVLDSVSLLEMMYDSPAQRRTEIYDFTRSLKKAGVTTFLTSEANQDNPYSSRHGIIEYLTDAVFVLRYVRAESRETRLAIEIVKIRNANHSRATKPYEITTDGISVYQQANIF